jgi:hypothetical protein
LVLQLLQVFLMLKFQHELEIIYKAGLMAWLLLMVISKV